MLRNDYRRAMIMLRGLEKGISGFIRLERRTLMGSMQFTVSGSPQGMMLNAVMLSQKDGDWSVAPVGVMRRDSRGQAGLTWSFDPRNIQGRALEDYDLAAVVHMNGGQCRLLLIGFVNGAKEVDAEQVRLAIQRLLGARADSSPMKARVSKIQTEKIVQAPTEGAAGQAEEAPTPAEQEGEELKADADDVAYADDLPPQSEKSEPLSESISERQEKALEDSDAQESAEEPARTVQRAEPIEELEEELGCCCDEQELGALDVLAQGEDEALEQAPMQEIISDEQAQALLMSAENAADFDEDLEVPAQQTQRMQKQFIDTDAPWPQSVESLRPMFKTGEQLEPFPSQFSFVRAEMPPESGMDFCAVGVRCRQGRPIMVCYALPARFEIEPPPGLEGYSWKGDTRTGWWVTWQSAESGEMLEESRAEGEVQGG